MLRRAMMLGVVVLAACSGATADTTTTTTEAVTTTTSTQPATTTTTTEAATTTEAGELPLPTAPQNLTVGPTDSVDGVLVTWDPLPDDQEIEFYTAYLSAEPGGDKEPRHNEPAAVIQRFGDKIGFIDPSAPQIDGQSCYVVTATNRPQTVGARSDEACYDSNAG